MYFKYGGQISQSPARKLNTPVIPKYLSELLVSVEHQKVAQNASIIMVPLLVLLEE
jgi:hypothetical protein